MMLILRSGDTTGGITPNSIFLAGPTLRSPHHSTKNSWREKALKIFDEERFEGELYLPEPFSAKGYEDQINWEVEHLNKAACIMFWIPRDLTILPGFTTNIEFGEWLNSGKIVLGYPKGVPHVGYMQYRALKNSVPVKYTLKETVETAIEIAGR